MQNQILSKVIVFADLAHGEQMRKYAHERYINHPVRVMNTCAEYTDDLSILAASLLHDVLEDTKITEQELLLFLESVMDKQQAANTVEIVVELTDVYTKENYPQLNRRKRKELEVRRLSAVSPSAQTIKYADLIDNSDNISAHDPDFALVFLKEGKNLLEAMNKGNANLYARTLQVVEENLRLVSRE